MAENSFYYDGSLCIACRGCQVACKQWNGLEAEKTQFFAEPGGYQNPKDLSPSTWTLTKFHEVADKDGVQWLFRRFHCHHCTEAACIEACPVEPKAMTRHPDFGTVYVNEDRCIGCGACAEACPFGVPHIDEQAEKSKKCTGCYDRVEAGLKPACVSTCPTGALDYGPKEQMYQKAEKRLAQLKEAGFSQAAVFGIKQLGGLHSILVLPAPLSTYGIDENVEVGDLEPIKSRARDKYAAFLRDDSDHRASVPAAVALAAIGVAGLERLRKRKSETSRENE